MLVSENNNKLFTIKNDCSDECFSFKIAFLFTKILSLLIHLQKNFISSCDKRKKKYQIHQIHQITINMIY